MTDDASTLIARNLKRLRERLGWSQAALAESSGVPRPTIAHLEAGQANPTLAVALRVARALGTTVDQLVAATPDSAVIVPLKDLPSQRLGRGKRFPILGETAQTGVTFERIVLKGGGRVHFELGAAGAQVIVAESGEFTLQLGETSEELSEAHVAFLRVPVEIQAKTEGLLYRLSGLWNLPGAGFP